MIRSRNSLGWLLSTGLLFACVLVLGSGLSDASEPQDDEVGIHTISGFSCATFEKTAFVAANARGAAGIPNPPSSLGEKRMLLYRVDFSDFAGAAIASNTAALLISNLNSF